VNSSPSMLSTLHTKIFLVLARFSSIDSRRWCLSLIAQGRKVHKMDKIDKIQRTITLCS
jgi:hypothetical protein